MTNKDFGGYVVICSCLFLASLFFLLLVTALARGDVLGAAFPLGGLIASAAFGLFGACSVGGMPLESKERP